MNSSKEVIDVILGVELRHKPEVLAQFLGFSGLKGLIGQPLSNLYKWQQNLRSSLN